VRPITEDASEHDRDDYPTAFYEGYAEHFQPLARDATTNATLRKMMDGRGATDLELFWLSAADGQLRSDGVKRKLVHPSQADTLDSAGCEPRLISVVRR